MKTAFKYIALTALVYGVGFLALRGAFSYIEPMGMDCDAFSRPWRACPFGAGIIGKQECIGGKWLECKPIKCAAEPFR